LAPNLIYKLIQDKNVAYFDYLSVGSESLQLIYELFIKLTLNDLTLEQFGYAKEKQNALKKLLRGYEEYKKEKNIFDRADIVKLASKKINDYLKQFDKVYVDSFKVGELTLHGSKAEKELIEKIKKHKTASNIGRPRKKHPNTLYQNRAFNAYDEVRVAIKIAKKLLLDGSSEDEILIVTTDTNEYLPYFYNLLDEYGMVGYDPVGVALQNFGSDLKALRYHVDPKVQKAYWQFQNMYDATMALSKELELPVDATKLQKTLLETIKVKKEKRGVLFCDPNYILSMQNRYKHIIFIGTDITHFPKKLKDNFLYTQKEAEKHFFANNPFAVATTLYSELQHLSDHLYIVTATYKGKRKLAPSIIIGENVAQPYDITKIRSRAEILKSQKRLDEPELREYQQSVSSTKMGVFDGLIDESFSHGNQLSASALTTYQKCPLQYYFGNVLGLAAPQDEQEGFDAAGFGNLMHKCFELFVKEVKSLKIEEFKKEKLYALMLEVSKKAYGDEEIQKIIGHDKDGKLKENINHKIALKTLQQGLEDPNSLQKNYLARFVDDIVEKEYEYFKNSTPEEKFILDQNFNPIDKDDEEKRFIKGYIDRLDNLEDGVNIVDYKTSLNSYAKKDFLFDDAGRLKNFQLGLYMLYAKQHYPNKESYNAYLVSYKKEKIETVKLEDKNYDDEYETKMKEQIRKIQDRINSGRFAFDNTDEKVCEHCNFATICHQAVLDKEIDND